MKAFVTGGAGFVGGAVVRQLLARGDQVVAAVRDPAHPGSLGMSGAALVPLDLAAADPAPLAAAMAGSDAVFHLAGSYRVGIRAGERPAMWDANVTATGRVLDAAAGTGVPRIVYTSTANVLGNTFGQLRDETFRRAQPPVFLSWYDETKYRAHLLVEERAAGGAPVVIAMPGMIYGPGDHSQAGSQIQQALEGRLPVLAAPDLGGNLAHVDDIAAGILLVHERGTTGSAYLLGGEVATMRQVIDRAAAVGGHPPPRFEVPPWLFRGVGALGAVSAFLRGPDYGELVRASLGVTYWFSDARARTELGYAPRPLDDGLRTMLPTSQPPERLGA
ncbi:MAG TPA: NAD-dependent epimerase/dehydratase family protein [Candidatus Limnocylindria bacterium]|nr:NAD-dependent epimerase/dehydratase family protein [Candidatus Limnocylindria bacterium]